MIAKEGKLKNAFIVKPTENSDIDLFSFGEKLHEYLVGNKDYIDSNIIIHLRGYNENPDNKVDAVEVYIYEECDYSNRAFINMLEYVTKFVSDNHTKVYVEKVYPEPIEETNEAKLLTMEEYEEFIGEPCKYRKRRKPRKIIEDYDDEALLTEEEYNLIYNNPGPAEIIDIEETPSIEDEFEEIRHNMISTPSQFVYLLVIESSKRGEYISAFVGYFYETFKRFMDSGEIEAFYFDEHQIIRVFINPCLKAREIRNTIMNVVIIFNGIEALPFATFTDYDRYMNTYYFNTPDTYPEFDEETNCIEVKNVLQLDKYYVPDAKSYVFKRNGVLVDVDFDMDVVSVMDSTIIANHISGNGEVSADTIICKSITADCIVCNKIIADEFVDLTKNIAAEKCFKSKLAIIEGAVTIL